MKQKSGNITGLMMKSDLLHKLDLMIENPVCELDYQKDYELVIAVMLSAQCTDKRVNEVTKRIFPFYDLKALASLDVKEIQKMIFSLGTSSRKAVYFKEIATKILKDYEGIVPNNRAYLEKLPGIGRKSCNVILSELFNEPTIAVDTHVERVTKKIGLAKEKDDVLKIEQRLMKCLDKEEYNKVNHQLLLLGRYICTAKNPKCENCLIKCKHQKTSE